MDIFQVLQRECVYIWYYFSVQFEQIFKYWLWGIVIGSCISVFAKNKIHDSMHNLKGVGTATGLALSSALGIASPLCMYGTIPLAASLSQAGIRDEWLASFMMSSILLNPQLIIYSAALGPVALTVRCVSCFLCGIVSGALVRVFYQDKPFFNFASFNEPGYNRDTDPNIFLRLLKNIGRNIRATGFWFFLGILLSALFQRYIPAESFAKLFGSGNKAYGVLMAATIGVPLYACGGGTIPLLQQWLLDGMSMGGAASFMITGSATKITNLGALKIVFGTKRFALYLLFIMLFSLVTGIITNSLVS